MKRTQPILIFTLESMSNPRDRRRYFIPRGPMPDKVDIEKQAEHYRQEHERSYGCRWITIYAPEPKREPLKRPTIAERKVIRANWDKIKHQLKGFGQRKVVESLVVNKNQLQNKKREEIEKLAGVDYADDIPF